MYNMVVEYMYIGSQFYYRMALKYLKLSCCKVKHGEELVWINTINLKDNK